MLRPYHQTGAAMFTGLIERIGTVRRVTPRGQSSVLEIAFAPGPYELKTGDSVAVNGLCLTATAVTADAFTVDVSRESLSRSTLGALRAGAKVNLERALAFGDRLGGHLVSGHVDAVGKIAGMAADGEFSRVTISAPPEILSLTVEKGSIAVDGISLTVNGVEQDRFWMMVIPETLARTTLGAKKPGDPVNLETDLIGKYVAKLLAPRLAGSKDEDLLRKLREEDYS